MSQSVADEPKKFEPGNKDTYTEKVTVRQFNEGVFRKPVENVPAHRKEIDGKQAFYTIPTADNSKAPKGSEITDKDGVVWVVVENKPGGRFHINYVEKKKP